MSTISFYTTGEKIVKIVCNDQLLHTFNSAENLDLNCIQFDDDECKEILDFLRASIENKHLTEIEITHFERDIYFTSANTTDTYTLAIAVYKGNEMDNFYDSDTELTDFFKISFHNNGTEIENFKKMLQLIENQTD